MIQTPSYQQYSLQNPSTWPRVQRPARTALREHCSDTSIRIPPLNMTDSTVLQDPMTRYGDREQSPHGEPTACAAGPFRICLCTTTSIINIILFFVIFRPRWLLDTHRQPAHSIPHLTISHVIIQDMARYPLAMRTASGYYAR